ncbi:hypothetical protein LX36DRAFT_626332 [Colletotrichum falcatum]|nr:hypothetical protein LX36DRAFT_626332 [Colletotrichum falcatum]
MCRSGLPPGSRFQLEFRETCRYSQKHEPQSETRLVDIRTDLGPPKHLVEQTLNRADDAEGGCRNSHVRKHNWQASDEDFPDPVGKGLDNMDKKLEEWRFIPRTVQNEWLRQTQVESSQFTRDPTCAGEEIFAKLFRSALRSGIVRCESAACQASWAAHEAAAPPCEWTGLRNFMLTIVCCRLPSSQLRLVSESMFRQPWDQPEFRGSLCVDVKGAAEMLLWATRLTEGDSGKGLAPMPIYDQDAVALRETLRPGYEAAALEQSLDCQAHGLCPNRLWNISFLCERGVPDIVPLAEIALRSPKLDLDESHKGCTPQLCELGEVNSTRVRQGHKCKSKNCQDEMRFPPKLLNEVFNRSEDGSNPPQWRNTAWRLDAEFELCSEISPQYMAISHVWSDGTGVGTKPAGQVNKCLYEYFAKIALDLGCDGVWWDSICMPTDRKARSLALASMLQNYERAKVTLVHDEYLVKFAWCNDGSPAAALVLSSWFTRGWTAAELWASQGHVMKVAFGNPDDPGGMPVIKDMEEDILAHDYVGLGGSPEEDSASLSRVPCLGHFIATDIVRLLRPSSQKLSDLARGQTSWLQNLLHILRRRTTSWSRDRMIIAGLMSLTEGVMDPEWSGQQITQNILSTAPNMPITNFIHGEVPMANYGPWSWCPRSIFDLGNVMPYDSGTFPAARVFPSGEMMTTLDAFEVLPDDVMVPCGSHPFLAARVSHAKANAAYSLLLASEAMRRRQLYILFQPFFTYFHRTNPVVEGHWAACVTLQTPIHPIPPARSERYGDPSVRSERRGSPHAQQVQGSSRRWMQSIRILFGGDAGSRHHVLPGLSFESVRSAVAVFRETDHGGYKMRRLLASNIGQWGGNNQAGFGFPVCPDDTFRFV